MSFSQIMSRLAGLCFTCSMIVSAQTVTFTSYPIPTPASGPSSITVGADGALWFTENNTSKVGRITTAGVITEFPTGAAQGLCGAHITSGPDGNLWATFGNAIGPGTKGTVLRINTAGSITGTFQTPQASSCAASITSGPDGALWLGQLVLTGDTIGRLATSGSFTNEFPIPVGGGPEPFGITTGPDGALWFTEFTAFRIGRVTTSGAFTEYLLPGITFNGTSFVGPVTDNPLGITAGPDGALWFTENGGNRIGRITTGGSFTEFTIPSPGANPVSITTGPDGALWFTEAGNKIGRITTGGAITEFVVTQPGSAPGIIVLGPDGALWFTEGGTNAIGRAVITPAGPPGPPGPPSTPAPASLLLTLTGLAAAGMFVAGRRLLRRS